MGKALHLSGGRTHLIALGAFALGLALSACARPYESGYTPSSGETPKTVQPPAPAEEEKKKHPHHWGGPSWRGTSPSHHHRQDGYRGHSGDGPSRPHGHGRPDGPTHPRDRWRAR
ncbi:MAG: hypothetical protein AABZ64_04470 [Nitrospinota bacterium]